jgi:hypothetical protein
VSPTPLHSFSCGVNVNASTSRAPKQARFGRYLLAGMLVLAPVTVASIAFAGSANAAGSPSATTLAAAQTVSDHAAPGPDCWENVWISSPTVTVTSSGQGVATVSVVPSQCEGADLTLAAYQTNGPDYTTAGVQTLAGAQTKAVSNGIETTFTLAVPTCYFQLDLIIGSDTPATLPAGVPYFNNSGTLLAHFNGGTSACVVATTTTTPPVTTTTTTPPVTTTTTPVTTTTSVLGTSTTRPPDGTSSTSLPTSVGALTFTKSPDAAVAAQTLPFTGSSLPVGPAIALAIELIVAGGAVVMITSGRRRTRGSHR